jgi:hypothetical protein
MLRILNSALSQTSADVTLAAEADPAWDGVMVEIGHLVYLVHAQEGHFLVETTTDEFEDVDVAGYPTLAGAVGAVICAVLAEQFRLDDL